MCMYIAFSLKLLITNMMEIDLGVQIIFYTVSANIANPTGYISHRTIASIENVTNSGCTYTYILICAVC